MSVPSQLRGYIASYYKIHINSAGGIVHDIHCAEVGKTISKYVANRYNFVHVHIYTNM